MIQKNVLDKAWDQMDLHLLHHTCPPENREAVKAAFFFGAGVVLGALYGKHEFDKGERFKTAMEIDKEYKKFIEDYKNKHPGSPPETRP